jgi:CTP:molybdopterin cytidylyltransferase MocA
MISTKPARLPTPRVVLLAAGFSTRMGKPKALARVRGISLIGRTLRVLAPFATAPIIVVVPPRASRLRAELRGQRATLVTNALRGEGLSSSVRRGLRQARYAAAVLLVSVDLPYLEQREIARLIARWRGARRRVAARRVEPRRVAARRIAAEAAAPLILPRRLYRSALGIGGDVGLKALIRQLPAQDISLVSLDSAAFDVDTARDLERARRHARPRES